MSTYACHEVVGAEELLADLLLLAERRHGGGAARVLGVDRTSGGRHLRQTQGGQS